MTDFLRPATDIVKDYGCGEGVLSTERLCRWSGGMSRSGRGAMVVVGEEEINREIDGKFPVTVQK